jgi:methylthioxylose transferase
MQRSPDAPTRHREPSGGDRESWFRRYRADLVWTGVICTVVVVAFAVPHLHLSWLTPLVPQNPQQVHPLAGTAPILGVWFPHRNWSTVCAVVLALAVVAWGPTVARRLPWRPLVLVAWLVATAWTVSLTLIDGVVRGWVGRMNGTGGYLAQLPHGGSVHSLIQGFAAHIPANSAQPWDISIAGNPPGALLTFFGLDRIGFGGPWWASALCVVVGASSAPAVLVAVRALGDQDLARRAAPFVALAPLAVWVGVSSDGYYAGVAAWGLALLAVAAGRATAYPVPVAFAGGLLLGCSIYLDYGLILLAVPALAIPFVTRNWRPVVGALAGALVVMVTFTGLGFWWLHGLTLLRQRYWAGIAPARPFDYWVWGDLVALTCAIGLPATVGLRRAFDRVALARRSGLHVLLVSFVVVVLCADLSGLSKAETERIWLPFAVWLVAAPALLPPRCHRLCLAAQAAGALVINSLLLTNW